MKIAFIGPGIMPIPPDGWGAVESLIWEIACELGEMGHNGTIINDPNLNELSKQFSKMSTNFIHLFYCMFFIQLWMRLKGCVPNTITAISSCLSLCGSISIPSKGWI